ncbi:MAG: DNA mismatch repair endonuclease MutL [Planctomycetota bacterium]|jgi:DNA mismatch repair protein MutL
MRKIHILAPEVAEKIAAGEVIERPVSLVKELVENAIDADASSVNVDVEKGGTRLVRVADDGVGMSREDLEVAFSRHATSKIRDIDDLFNVHTMGFRGEALASIAAVARVGVLTKSEDDEDAWQTEIEPPRRGETRPAGRARGTTVEVRNLFFNIPARRKFLKKDETELGHITRYLQAVALGFPSLSFSLTSNGRKVFSAPSVETVRRRAASFYGEDLAEDLIEADGGAEGMKVYALLAPPFYSRVNRSSQYVYVNGRYVRDRLLQSAVSQAYQGLIENRRFPIVFLYLTVPAQDVDVNVHPTKMEIRFRNAGAVRSTVVSVLSQALLQADFAPRIESEGDALLGTRAENIRRSIAAFYEKRVAGGEGFPPGAAARAHGGGLLAPPGPPVGGFLQPPGSLMQVKGTYIVRETDEGIVIIDQHALHERVLYGEIRARLAEGGLQGQRLLVPEIVEVTPAERIALEECRGLLARIGIDGESFGEDAFAFHSFPAVLGDSPREKMLRELISEIAANRSVKPVEEALDALAEILACHSAVRAGDVLEAEELQALLEKAGEAEGRFACPHGRPTKLLLTFEELERRFGRK